MMAIKTKVKQAVIALGLMALGYGATTWMLGSFNTKQQAEGVVSTPAAYALGDKLPNAHALNKDSDFKELEWDSLIPSDWDPTQALKGINLSDLQDNDPKAQDALIKMKRAWSNAPVNTKLNGQKIRIPGFAIPLEQSEKGVSELLLVPYFGACIHTPPPPANQIIHVTLSTPEPAIGTMQPYWVWGHLETQHFRNDLGDAAYRLVSSGLRPYDDLSPPQ